jgi:hypothetical protein
MQAIIRTVEVMGLLVPAVVHGNIEASGHGDENLMRRLEGMPCPRGAARNVIEIEDPRDLERDVARPFNEGQVAPRVCDSGKVDYLAIFDSHYTSLQYTSLR